MQSTSNSSKDDVQILPGPADVASEISVCPIADFIAVSSWDNQVRVYQMAAGGAATPKASITHEQPVLSTAWSKDGTKLFSAGADKVLRVMDVSSGQVASIPTGHEQPIRRVRWDGQNSTIITGSWDKTIKFWDLRQPRPAATVNMPQKVYAMDSVNNWLIVGTADHHIAQINLTSPTMIAKTGTSNLKWQTRDVACFPNGAAFAVSSIDGRVSIQYLEESRQSDNFSFRCHRVETSRPGDSKTEANAFAVNVLSTHPTHGTLATGGSDGAIYTWDKDSKTRLSSLTNLGGPITAMALSKHSDVVYYAVGYDWSKGYENYLPNAKLGVFVHKVIKSAIEPKVQTSLYRKR